MDTLSQNLPLLLEKTWQQIYLTAIAMAVAIVIGIPLGIWIAKKNKIKPVILAIASILQTIPSLALLALLLPFLGIGVKPALVALSIYAFLPIIRNTATGIYNISPNIIEAANGLGFTAGQKLWMVELPLALPVIIAGIRTATSMSVGIATLAAFIGAGGLGDFIYQGLSLNNTPLILLGAIPAAALALILDFMIGRIEHFIAERKYKHYSFLHKKTYFIVSALMALFFFMFIMMFSLWKENQSNTIIIGSKNFTEQYILAELMAQLIENDTHFTVVRKFNLGGTLFCQGALLRGDIDLYPEYSGTAYMVILKKKYTGDATQVYNDVTQAYQKQFQLAFLSPFGFNNTQALAVRQDFSSRYHVFTLSDLKTSAHQLSIGVPADFYKRPDGFISLEKYYGLQFKDVKLMDAGLMYQAIKNKDVDVIMAFSTDARIVAYHLALLQDNKHIFPPYDAAPVVRDQTLRAHPQIKYILNLLANRINNAQMQHLNYEVDIEKKSVAVVAREFLLQNNLITH